MARIEMKRRYTWTIFQNIEYSAEQDQVRLYNFFNDLLLHMPEAAKQVKDQDQLSTSSTESLDDNFEDESDDSLDEGIEDSKSYKGPHLSLPLEKPDLDMLINLFRKRKYKLHARYVALILREGARKLRRLDNINRASTQIKASTITVVGDLHGKLDDLLVILYKVISKENARFPYLMKIQNLCKFRMKNSSSFPFLFLYRMAFLRTQIFMFLMVSHTQTILS